MEQAEAKKKPNRQMARVSQSLLVGCAFPLKTIFRSLQEAEQVKLMHSFDRIDRLLEDSAKELLSLSPPSPADVASCAAQHIQEGLTHLEIDDYEQARISFDQSARLLKNVDKMVM